MKKMIILALALTSGCHGRKDAVDIANTSPVAPDHQWTVYEGRVPLDEKHNLYIEVALLPGAVEGIGYFRLTESLEEENAFVALPAIKGMYSVVQGDDADNRAFHLHRSAHAAGVKRAYFSNSIMPGIKTMNEEYFRNTDLVLQVKDQHTLIVLDKKAVPITREAQFNLARRMSRPFTVEGYFTHKGDSADFFEINTKEAWAVSKRGTYNQAINQYHQLAKTKFENIYLKAVGYSIHHVNKEGKEVEALVFKKIIQMTSSPVVE
jgi:hypothetical protein